MSELSNVNYNLIMETIQNGSYHGVSTVPVVSVEMSLSKENDDREETRPSHLCNIPVNLN